MTKKKMLEWIKTLLQDIEGTPLSKSCGKYCYIMYCYDGKYLVKYFVGKTKYGLANLDSLEEETIRKIYEDLKQDFDIIDKIRERNY